jgi:hypothetical protein
MARFDTDSKQSLTGCGKRKKDYECSGTQRSPIWRSDFKATFIFQRRRRAFLQAYRIPLTGARPQTARLSSGYRRLRPGEFAHWQRQADQACDGRTQGCSLLHSFLGKGCPDDVPRQVLHRFLFFLLDAVPTEDMESGMSPCLEQKDHFPGDLSTGDQHAKDLMPEYGLQLFQFQRRGHPEHPFCRRSSRP